MVVKGVSFYNDDADYNLSALKRMIEERTAVAPAKKAKNQLSQSHCL